MMPVKERPEAALSRRPKTSVDLCVVLGFASSSPAAKARRMRYACSETSRPKDTTLPHSAATKNAVDSDSESVSRALQPGTKILSCDIPQWATTNVCHSRRNSSTARGRLDLFDSRSGGSCTDAGAAEEHRKRRGAPQRQFARFRSAGRCALGRVTLDVSLQMEGSAMIDDLTVSLLVNQRNCVGYHDVVLTKIVLCPPLSSRDAL
jgi:hypothetical protein